MVCKHVVFQGCGFVFGARVVTPMPQRGSSFKSVHSLEGVPRPQRRSTSALSPGLEAELCRPGDVGGFLAAVPRKIATSFQCSFFPKGRLEWGWGDEWDVFFREVGQSPRRVGAPLDCTLGAGITQLLNGRVLFRVPLVVGLA